MTHDPWAPRNVGQKGWVGDEVLLVLEAPKVTKMDPRAPVDLVFVLDISGSMGEEDKLVKMKGFLDHVLDNWIKIRHHVGIVTFNDQVNVLCPITRMTADNINTMKGKVKRLSADSGTNIEGGLREAVKLLRNNESSGHGGVIVLLSDGDENIGNAASVDVENIWVETFGYGKQHNAKLLSDISNSSHDGGYNPALEPHALTTAFSPPFFVIGRNVIRDLDLTLEQEPTMDVSNLVDPNSKRKLNRNRKEQITSSAKKVIHIGSLFSEQVYRVTVSWPITGTATAMTVNWTYKDPTAANPNEPIHGTPVVVPRPEPPAPVAHRRNRALTVSPEPAPVVPRRTMTERTRLNHVAAIKEAKESADLGNLKDAQEKLGFALETLDGIRKLPDADVSKKTISFLYTELEELLELMDAQEVYVQEGLPYALTCISSHDRQRPTQRTSFSPVRLFCTPLMDKFLGQAIEFDESRA